MTKNIMIVGVGGQGTLLASKLLGRLLLGQGYDVKVSEVHGMSQRGGSVTTYVRYGDSVASPVIDLGEADCILSFEQLEAARALPYLKKGGLLVYSTCTLNRKENSGRIQAFLKKHPEYELRQEKTMFPFEDRADGFYAAALLKRN